jgi:hypothetical protein
LKARKLMMNSEEMRKSRPSIGITAIILFVIVSAQTTYATVEDRSTFQQWYFNESEPNYGPVAPCAGTLDNEFGIPLLYVGNRAQFLQGAAPSAWALRNDEMDIYIPNYQDNSPQSWKEITIGLTWKAGTESIVPDLPKDPVVWAYPQGQILGRKDEPHSYFPGWTSTTFTIDIQPNPKSEWVYIKNNILLHDVSISTVCVPEPATIGLSIGGALLAFKRSRNRYGKKQITEIVGDMNL